LSRSLTTAQDASACWLQSLLLKQLMGALEETPHAQRFKTVSHPKVCASPYQALSCMESSLADGHAAQAIKSPMD
jgi:hypothetical protein